MKKYTLLKTYILLILIILASLCVIVEVYSEEYIKMNETQVMYYLETTPFEQVINDIIKLDYIEHVQPEIEQPEVEIIIKDNIAIVKIKPIKMTIGDYLDYTIEIDSIEVEIPESNEKYIWGAAGVATGVLAAILINFL
jgi:hypothetical protein